MGSKNKEQNHKTQNQKMDLYRAPNTYLGNFLLFFFEQAAENWNKIFIWAIFIFPVVVESYYFLYLEQPIFIQNTTLMILWFGFSAATYFVGYLFKFLVI